MAGAVIGALRVMLGIDTAAFEDGLDIAQRRIASAGKSLQATGANIAKTGAVLTATLTAPLVAFGTASFNAASDAAELQSAFDQTFGRMSATMNKWAVETGDALGRSTQEMQKAANTFGIFFNTAVDPAKAAQMSQTFAKLAQDLGSFYNVDTETAIEKLRSGLSGESEPLRDFGVFLTEASVKAKAMQLGLAGVGNELTEQEKIVARYALILEATKNAQGDVERTSSGTANQLRAAQAAFEELQVVVGTKLLPVLTPVIEGLASVLNALNSLPPGAQTAIVAVAAVGAALGPVILGVGGLVSGLGAAIPAIYGMAAALVTTAIPAIASFMVAMAPVLLPIAAVSAAFVGVIVAIRNWDVIQSYAAKVVSWMQGLYQGVKTWIGDKLGAVWDGVAGKIRWVADKFKWLDDVVVRHSYIPDMVDSIGEHMRRLDGEMVNPTRKATDAAAQAFQQLQMRVSGILDRLFPDQARFNQLKADIADLTAYAKKAGWTPDQTEEALKRLRYEAGGVDPSARVGIDVPTPEAMRVPDLSKATEDMAKRIEAANDNTVASFAGLARDVAGSLGNLVQNIRSGDWLSALSGVLDIIGQVSSLLGGGAKPATRTFSTGSLPRFATGGSFVVNGMRGIDNNLLALNGRPIARVSHGETVAVGHGGGGAVEIIPSPYFDVRARAANAPDIQSMGVRAAAGGAQIAAADAARRQRRRLG